MAVLSNTWNDRLIDSIFVLPLLNFSMMEKNFENQVFNKIKKRCTWSHVTFMSMCPLGLLWRGEGRGSGITPQQWRVTSTTCFSNSDYSGKFGLVGLPAPEPNEKKKTTACLKGLQVFWPSLKFTFFYHPTSKLMALEWENEIFSAFFVWGSNQSGANVQGAKLTHRCALWCFWVVFFFPFGALMTWWLPIRKALINYQLTVHFDPRCAEVSGLFLLV